MLVVVTSLVAAGWQPTAVATLAHHTRFAAAVHHRGVAMLDVPMPPAGLTVRKAVWPDDYEAVCAVRAPTSFVTEDGAVGFMGKRVELSP